MLITQTEIILVVHRHTGLLSVAVGRHFLFVYTCTHIVRFPNDQLLGTRLALTFELRHYDGKVGASIKVWNGLQWLKLYRDRDSKEGLILQTES